MKCDFGVHEEDGQRRNRPIDVNQIDVNIDGQFFERQDYCGTCKKAIGSFGIKEVVECRTNDEIEYETQNHVNEVRI